MPENALPSSWQQSWSDLRLAAGSQDLYIELGLILGIYLLAFLVARRLQRHVPDKNNPVSTLPIWQLLSRAGKLAFPVIAVLLLRITADLAPAFTSHAIVFQIAVAIASLLLFNSFVTLLVTNPIAASLFRWVGTPILFLHLTGYLDELIGILESVSLNVGNIEISAYGVLRVLIFGSLLFWLGRVSNATGQTIIRRQHSLHISTREVFAKLFEVFLFFAIFLLLLQVMGINLTALAVFGGALGVGLGFGLQSIASNFISGVIILLDRSITVGDYIELEGGNSGTVTAMSMRSTTLETYDGKDIVVPNEKFITSEFINWTHKNKKQRYRVDFSVGYDTDIRKMAEMIKKVVAEHPQVLSGPGIPFEEQPDCEISGFGDNGIDCFTEFWMEGIDDGRNRVGGDLMLAILEALREARIEIPFPQRDVRIIKNA